MLVRPILPLLKTTKEVASMSYLGIVEDNKDPEKLCRIKVRISPYDDFTTDELPWASPILGTHGNSSNSGGFNIPEIGSQVRIYFPSKDLTAPYYTGAELNESNRVTLFDDNYPNVYGYKDSRGNFYKVDKEAGTAHFQHESTSNMQVTPDGSVVVSLRGGPTVTFSSYGAFGIDVGMIKVNGNPDGSLGLQAESDVVIESPSVILNTNVATVTGSLSVGNGASGVIWGLGQIITVTDGIITSIKGFV